MMTKKILLLCLALMLAILPVLAQDDEEEPEYDCPSFTSASAVERTSYYMGEGAAFMRSGNYAAAINAYGCIVQQIDDSHRDAYFNRALAYTARREYEEAIEDYDAAIALDGDYLEAFNNRGVVYTAMEEYEEAMSDFDRVLSLDGDFAAGYINRGVLHANLEEYDAAIDDMEQAIEIAGLEAVLEELRDPDRPDDAEDPEFDRTIANAYALIGVIHSQRALSSYQDYLTLTGGRADSRIQSAAGALESRSNFELRFDDGTWMLVMQFADQ
jgi:tetratricopeptide (TPR) repeat protein